MALFEDIHWAEATLLDLIEHLADLARDAPLLLLCAARPELLDKRTGWGGGKLNATTVLLEPLASDMSAELIERLPGGSALPLKLRTRILAAAEGNPLFLEEMLGMLVDDGLVVPAENGQWLATAELEDFRVPPTIAALLAARLDQLTPDERQIAERGAVAGRSFDVEAIAELSPEDQRPRVLNNLVALVRKDLLRPERAELSPGDAFRFRHVLIRDAAYGALTKGDRAALHEGFADWLERASGERLQEYEEVLGYHLEEAYRDRIEVQAPETETAAIGARASGYLLSAARRAWDRGDAGAASGLFLRASGLIPAAGAAAFAPELIYTLYFAGMTDAALAQFPRFEPLAVRDPALRRHLRVGRLGLELAHVGDVTFEGAERETLDIIAAFDATNDVVGLCRGWLLYSFITSMQGRESAAASAAKRAIVYAEQAGLSYELMPSSRRSGLGGGFRGYSNFGCHSHSRADAGLDPRTQL